MCYAARRPKMWNDARDVVAAVPPARVLGQRNPGTGHLPGTRRAADLGDRLDDLSQAGGTDRVPAGEQAAAGVDRPRTAQHRVTAPDQGRAVSRLGQAELLVDDELRRRGSVMHLDAVQVGGAQPSLLVRGRGNSWSRSPSRRQRRTAPPTRVPRPRDRGRIGPG